MFVKAREGAPFEELYRRFKRGIEAHGIIREYRSKQRFKPAHEVRRDKIRSAGVLLKDYCGSPLRGVVSGLNEAFVIDSITCERLVAEDRKSQEILKPFLEGRDLKPWRYDWRGYANGARHRLQDGWCRQASGCRP